MAQAESIAHCPALFIAAPASGQGKTTVTAALARHHRGRGLRVRVFKTGPDFLDPMILEQASGAPVYQLDLWMGGGDNCRALLYQAAREADVILVEGVMGLFDGDPSSADLAMRFGIPVLAVIDGGAMAQTFGAIAHGLRSYRDGLPFAGVFANRVAGEQHYQMLVESLPAGIRSLGWLARDADITLPERHLGLRHAAEITDLDARIERAAASLRSIDEQPPSAVPFAPGETRPLPAALDGVRIAVARDEAFSFIYRANLELLAGLGAQLSFFSPLRDAAIPGADGRRRPMAGLIPGEVTMQHRLANIGLYSLDLPEGRLHASYLHLYMPSNPLAVARLFALTPLPPDQSPARSPLFHRDFQ